LPVNTAVEQPLRIVVNDVHRNAPTSLVISAKVESGHVEAGDKLFLMPEANPVTVKGQTFFVV
jgi:translation elongation factor EF-1alpha